MSRDETLCIGLDIAWFGGTASDRWSRYDCIGSVRIGGTGEADERLSLSRVPLGTRTDRDPQASKTLAEIERLLQQHTDVPRVIFAVDAPIQADERLHLPRRMGLSPAGSIERRACENHLSRHRQKIDARHGGARGWHPNIQPGAPLAPRVQSLIDGLCQLGLCLWTPQNCHAHGLVIECFPAEAIWAVKRQDGYPRNVLAADAMAYKKQKRNVLSGDEVTSLTRTVLNGFAGASGDSEHWNRLVDAALALMLADSHWQINGRYRGGKLLDDVVDTLICLATSLSFARRCAHLWQDPAYPEDGHIIGPGCPNEDDWFSANGC